MRGTHGVIASSFQQSGIAAPTDYIAYWKMAGDATDETGNYNITLNGGAVQNSDHVDYDGTNDYGQCARLAFNSNAFTIVMRISFDTIDATNGCWIVNSRSGTTGSLQEFQVQTFGTLAANVFTTGTAYAAAGATTLSAGLVYVIAIRYDGAGGILEVFVDDPETADGSDSGGSGLMYTGSAHTQFAKRGWESPSANACGEMDQSRTVVYDYSVTDTELAAIFTAIENDTL